jgi:SAM-dependent methyltransferase
MSRRWEVVIAAVIVVLLAFAGFAITLGLDVASGRSAVEHDVGWLMAVQQLDDAALRRALTRRGREGADAVFAARVLHHANRPADAMRSLGSLARPGGHVVVLDYCAHEDEALRAHQADLWLGFEADDLRRYARAAGLVEATVTKIPGAWCGHGPDRHVPWQVLVARAPEAGAAEKNDDTAGTSPARSARAPKARKDTRR